MTYVPRICGPGVAVRYPCDDFDAICAHWYKIRAWCEEQGWKMSDDYHVPAKIPEGKWYFKTKEQQMWFALRWS